MKNELKSLLPALALVATTAIGFGQEKPTPIPPESGGFGRSGQSVNKSTVVTQSNKRGPREIRAYSASVAPFNERAAKTMIIRSSSTNQKPNDWITVVIRGKRFDTAVWPAEGDKFRFEVDNNVIYNSDEMGSESTMVLRVKKSDVDNIAKKKGEKGSLKDKVTVTTY